MTKTDQKIRIFVGEYLIDGNGKRSATVAGWSAKTAEVTASQLLRKPKVQALLDEARKKLQEKTEVTQEWVVKNLKEVVERCMQHEAVMEFDHVEKEMVQKKGYLIDEETGKLKEVGIYEFDSAGSNRALELIGKNLGMFTEKHDVTLRQPEPIQYVPAKKRDASNRGH